MKRSITLLIIIFIAACQTVSTDNWGQKVQSNHINFPGNFYTKKIKTCSAMPDNKSFSRPSIVKIVEGVIGFNWAEYHRRTGSSLVVEHSPITTPIKVMMTATHNAISNNPCNGYDCTKGVDEIEIAKKLLLDIAKANTLYNSIGYHELKKKPKCWENNDPSSPCWYHEYEFAAGWFSNYLINALWLKSELSPKELKIVNKYVEKMYRKFLKPIEFREQEQGLYQMANGGLSILIYASWANDKELAAKEINHRFKEMDRLFYDDGYLNDNSFRGYRGQWYHSYGVDIALGYVYIAKLWGATVPEKLYNKLVNSAKVVNLAITDKKKFKSRKNPNGKARNRISDPSKARLHTHQMAIAIDTLMKIVTGIELADDPGYLSKREYHIRDGIDDLIGFNPNCIG